MKTKELQKTTGMKLAVLSFVLFMFLTGTISAQHRHHRQGPPPNIDSIWAANGQAWDTLFHHHHDFDTILGFRHDHDSIPFPPNWGDSGTAGGRHHGHDSIPGNGGDSTWTGGGKHDSIPSPPPPPNWGDSSSAWGGHHHGHDSIPAPPPPPNWGDSSWTGGGWIDSIPGPPNWGGGGDSIPGPPNWGDSTSVGGGGCDTTGGHHHRDLLVNSNNNPIASLSVFPNPVFETATIRITNASSTVTFKMYESNGRLVQIMNNLSNGDFQLIKGNLTSGIYFYEMLDGNTIATKGSLIIQ